MNGRSQQLSLETQTLLVAICLILAAVMQSRLAHSIAFHHAQPDFIVIVLACGGTLIGGQRGILLGFWAGLLTAALAPVLFGTYLASRTIAGAFAGTLQRSMIRDSFIVPPLVVFSTTLVAELCAVLITPTHHVRLWGVFAGGEMAYNTLLALPFYFALRMLRIGQRGERPFSRQF